MAIASPVRLKEAYESLKEQNPKIRIRNAAIKLGVSELELLELELGSNVVRLKGDWTQFLENAHKLGHVMALTRNEYAVHERKGIYHNVSFQENKKMGVAVNPDIDLRFLMWNWKYGYAVRVENHQRVLHSFQFFDAYGEAVHKIYLTGKSDPLAYNALLATFKDRNQTRITEVEERKAEKSTAIPDEQIDQLGFKEGWLALQDTHDFFPLLKKYEVQRTQALRLAPEGYAYQVEKNAVVQVFEEAAEGEVPIMVFVNSKGCIQIHTGPVKKLFHMEQWFNIMDPEFNLHLNMDGVHEAWVVKKPTADGMVTSLELFDQDGNLIVYLFGKRKPGLPELESWRKIINRL
jgi:putative hemin transport protein